MRENRRSQRHRIKEWAKIILNEGRLVLNCTVTDISDTGARLRIGPAEVPTAFFLYRKSNRSLREVAVMNRGFQTIGISFAGDPLDLASERAKALLGSIAVGA